MKTPRSLFSMGSIALLSLVFTGCLEVAGDGIDSEIIPDIQIECPSLICSAASSTVFIGFLRDTSVECDEYFADLNSTNYTSSWDASGSTTATQSSPLLFGTVTSWVDFNGAAIGSIANGQYRVCGHYDLDNDQVLDAGEAVGEMLVFPGTSPQVMDDWFNI